MKLTTNVLLTFLMLVVTGCGGGTRVIKDGFMARQVTEEPIRFLRATRSWDTDCRWDQLTMEKSSGTYFCPPPSTKEDYNTKAYAAHIDPAKSDAVLSAAIHGLFFVAGMGTFAAVMPATQVTQAGTTINENFSTKFIGR